MRSPRITFTTQPRCPETRSPRRIAAMSSRRNSLQCPVSQSRSSYPPLMAPFPKIKSRSWCEGSRAGSRNSTHKGSCTGTSRSSSAHTFHAFHKMLDVRGFSEEVPGPQAGDRVHIPLGDFELLDPGRARAFPGSASSTFGLQGYLAHKKSPPPRTLQWDHAYSPRRVLGGWAFSHERGTPVGE